MEAVWLRSALARTEKFYKSGPREPVTWVLTTRKDFPPGAFVAGTDSTPVDQPSYVARAFIDTDVRRSMLRPTFFV